MTYTWGDVNRVREAIVTNPAHFNIMYTGNGPAVTACPPPSMPPANEITTAWALVCSVDSPATQPNTSIADKTLFADDQHCASTAQRILGNYYYRLVKASWPELIPPPLFPPLLCPWPAIP